MFFPEDLENTPFNCGKYILFESSLLCSGYCTEVNMFPNQIRGDSVYYIYIAQILIARRRPCHILCSLYKSPNAPYTLGGAAKF